MTVPTAEKCQAPFSSFVTEILKLRDSSHLHENLKLLVEANYIALWLDNSPDVWGGYHAGGRRYAASSTEDAWNMNVSFIYKF